MSIKSVKQINGNFKDLNHSLKETQDSVDKNTVELKMLLTEVKKVKEIEEQKDKKDWRVVEPFNTQTRYPLAETSPKALKVESLVKKLDII